LYVVTGVEFIFLINLLILSVNIRNWIISLLAQSLLGLFYKNKNQILECGLTGKQNYISYYTKRNEGQKGTKKIETINLDM